MTSPLLTTREAAALLACSPSNVYSLIEAGQIGYVRVGSRGRGLG